MKRPVLALLISLTLFALAALPARASQSSGAVDWQSHDTAVYVVSTINLLHPVNGVPAARAFHDVLGTERYAVLADQVWPDRYFIALQGSSGEVVGALEYALGWRKPRAVTDSTIHLGIRPAGRHGIRAYHHDLQLQIGVFTSPSPT
jgi:hypothetical protein